MGQKTSLDLKNADLEEIAALSLHCGFDMDDLEVFLMGKNPNGQRVKYTDAELKTISQYRSHLRRVTDSPALGW